MFYHFEELKHSNHIIALVPLMCLGCVYSTLLQLCIGNKFTLFKCTGSARGIWANPCITQFMSP